MTISAVAEAGLDNAAITNKLARQANHGLNANTANPSMTRKNRNYFAVYFRAKGDLQKTGLYFFDIHKNVLKCTAAADGYTAPPGSLLTQYRLNYRTNSDPFGLLRCLLRGNPEAGVPVNTRKARRTSQYASRQTMV